MADKKNTSKPAGKTAPVKVEEGSHSPQRELLEKSRHNPGLGRKPAGKDEKLKSAPGKAAKKTKSDATEELGSTTLTAKERMPKHKTLDSSGQDRNL